MIAVAFKDRCVLVYSSEEISMQNYLSNYEIDFPDIYINEGKKSYQGERAQRKQADVWKWIKVQIGFLKKLDCVLFLWKDRKWTSGYEMPVLLAYFLISLQELNL